jgi:hypothetical protein
MRTNYSIPSFDKPFDFDLVSNARVIPMINALRFKLTNRALHRAGLVRPSYLNPRAIIVAVLKNDPEAMRVAASLQRHLQDIAPETAPAFKGLPFNFKFRTFAVEHLVHPAYYRKFEQRTWRLIYRGVRGIDPMDVIRTMPRNARPVTPKADPRFYALLWMLENPGHNDAFNLGKIEYRHSAFPNKTTRIAL